LTDNGCHSITAYTIYTSVDHSNPLLIRKDQKTGMGTARSLI